MPYAGPVISSASRAEASRKKKRNARRDTRDEVKMDANRLIAEVFKRPALWNQRHVSYHNREVTNRVWMEISGIFKLPKPILKAKWKGLRDTFRAELKKEQVYKNNKYQRNRPLWVHFESLQFLKDQMIPRPPVWECNNCSDEDYNKHYQNGINGNDDSQRDFGDSLSEHIVAKSAENITIHEKCFKEDQAAQLNNSQYQISSCPNGSEESEVMMQNISPEDVLLNASTGANSYSGVVNAEGDSDSSIGIPIDHFNNQHFDDNYYFFVSLLPHMKQLSAERRMFLRMKIQELVYDEVYGKNTTSSQENFVTS